LQTLTAKINQVWGPAAVNTIDPFKFEVDNVAGPCPSDGGTKCFFGAGLTNCLHSTSTWKISNFTGLKQLTFSPLTVIQNNSKDVAAHTGRGPDAGKITDGIFAPEGSSYTDARAIVLPSAGPAYGLTIDFGKVVTICGNTACGSGPKIQADNNDQYLLDYSTDGVTWKLFGAFTTVRDGGLRTRAINGPPGTPFSARYVRVYADPDIGDGKYSVAELELRDSLGVVISRGAQAIGPRPAGTTYPACPPAPWPATTWACDSDCSVW
jgi:hypothetical protein